MRAFEKLVCGRSRAAEIANMGGSIAGDKRRLGREGAELETAWVGGLASEKLVCGSRGNSSRNSENNPFGKKGIGM